MRLYLILLFILFSLMFWVNKKQIYKVVYVALNLVLITIIFNFFIMFTSFIEFSPWHETGGIQLLVPIYMAIWLCAISGLMMLLSISIPVPATLQYLPFAAGMVLGAIVLYEEPENIYVQASGAIISASLIIAIITVFLINIEKTFLTANKKIK